MRINDVILQTATRGIAFIILAFSIYILFAGHNNPGGGFIGGLMTAAAIVLLYLSYDFKQLMKRIRVDFIKVTALGLLLAALTGVGSFFFDVPFLTHTFGSVALPFGFEIELASAMLFDLGVYLTVVGVTLTIISTIGEDQR